MARPATSAKAKPARERLKRRTELRPSDIRPPKQEDPQRRLEREAQKIAAKLGDRAWRLNNLYTVETKTGEVQPFRMNAAQAHLLANLHCFNVVLKARQRGFTTFISLLMLDACLFNGHTRAGVVAHTRDDAEKIFTHKIRRVYERLAPALRAARPARTDRAQQLTFANGSEISVGTSLRGGTLQWLLVSEYGKICAKYPDKAREVRTGALNTVQAGQALFVESTAEGAEGHFHDLCGQAQALAQEGARLTPLDPKFHFHPWFEDADYALDEEAAEAVPISPSDQAYFDKLEHALGVTLRRAQRAWYVKKKAQQGEDMLREFPSTPEEAFAAAVEGAYYTGELRIAREQGRVTRVPHEPRLPVHTAWDLGLDDYMAAWLVQIFGREVRLIGYREWSGVGLTAVIADLNRGWPNVTWGWDVMPHDVEVRELTTGVSRKDTLSGLGRRVLVAPAASVADGIEAARGLLARSWFDAEACDQGLKRLAAYKKEWDDAMGVWKAKPRHDDASHGADAYRTLAARIDALDPDGGGLDMSGWRGARRTA